MITVTGYVNPDIDCVACAVGYAELQNRLGKEARAIFSGDINAETEYVKQYLGGINFSLTTGGIEKEDIILVDTSDKGAIDKSIDVNRVIEVIDHRKLAYIQDFPNAKLQIDLVGSCATLIAERFQDAGVAPSRESAVLLYSAIISNTVNFKSHVTTQRDRVMVEWIKDFADIPKVYVSEMFEYKSNINKENIEEILTEEFKFYEIKGNRVGIVQLEITDSLNRVAKFENEIREILLRIKKEKSVDYILLSCVDVKEGFNYLLTIDPISSSLFSKVFGVSDLEKGVKLNDIIMRKEIYPKILKFLEEEES